MILTLQTHQKSSNNVEQIEVVLLGTGTSIPVEKYDKIPTRIVSETSNLLMTSNLNVNGTVKKPAIRHVMSIDAIYDQVEFLEKICSVHFSYIVDAFFNETDRFPIKSRKLMLLDGIHPIDTTRIVSETSNLLMTSNLNVNGTVKKPAIRHVMSIDAIYDQVEFLEKICSVRFSYIVDAFFNETDRFPIKSRKLMLLDGIHPVDKWHLWLSFHSWALKHRNYQPYTGASQPLPVSSMSNVLQ